MRGTRRFTLLHAFLLLNILGLFSNVLLIPPVPEKNNSSNDSSKDVLDTSVIVVSNLIPMHPNISQTTAVIDSAFKYLEGLPSTTPVFISIDFLVEPDSQYAKKHNYASNNQADRQRLQQYISNLRVHYLPMKNVHILPAVEWGHINYNIKKALEVVETKYVYVLQHDLEFLRPINHKAVVKTFDEYYPEHIFKLEFPHTVRSTWAVQANPSCYGMETPLQNVNGIQITKQDGWSDQNHFTTKEYYLKALEDIGSTPRSPEFPLNVQARNDCNNKGAHLYGGPDDEPYVGHKDGRFSKAG